MNAREAIATAKDWVSETFDGEGLVNLGLEEVKFDDHQSDWLITIGFSRPWDVGHGIVNTLGGGVRPRSYKIVRVRDRDGEVVLVENRN